MTAALRTLVSSPVITWSSGLSGTTLYPSPVPSLLPVAQGSYCPMKVMSPTNFLVLQVLHFVPAGALGEGGAPPLYSQEMQGGGSIKQGYVPHVGPSTGCSVRAQLWGLSGCQRQPESPCSEGCEHRTPTFPESDPRLGEREANHAPICFTNWVTEPLRLTRKQNKTLKPKSTTHYHDVTPSLGEGQLERQDSALGILLRDPRGHHGPALRGTSLPCSRSFEVCQLAWELSSRGQNPTQPLGDSGATELLRRVALGSPS